MKTVHYIISAVLFTICIYNFGEVKKSTVALHETQTQAQKYKDLYLETDAKYWAKVDANEMDHLRYEQSYSKQFAPNKLKKVVLVEAQKYQNSSGQPTSEFLLTVRVKEGSKIIYQGINLKPSNKSYKIIKEKIKDSLSRGFYNDENPYASRPLPTPFEISDVDLLSQVNSTKQ